MGKITLGNITKTFLKANIPIFHKHFLIVIRFYLYESQFLFVSDVKQKIYLIFSTFIKQIFSIQSKKYYLFFSVSIKIFCSSQPKL